MPMRLELRTAPVDFVGLGVWTVVDLCILEWSLPKMPLLKMPLLRCPFAAIRDGMGDFALEAVVAGIWLARLARRLGVRVDGRRLLSRDAAPDKFVAVVDRVERVCCGAGAADGGLIIDDGVGICDARLANLDCVWLAIREEGRAIEVSVEDLLCWSIPAVGCNLCVLCVDSWLAGRGGNGICEALLPRKWWEVIVIVDWDVKLFSLLWLPDRWRLYDLG